MSSMYRSKHIDNRTNEEKELEECTFQPKINGPSPFISERTLRQYTQLQRRAPPPPPSQPSQRSSSLSISPIKKSPKTRFKTNNNDTMLGGMYTKANGLIRGPPHILGLPMFYFDPFSPPNFAEGTYGAPNKTVTVEEEEVEIVAQEKMSSSKLVPPPLPPFVLGDTKKDPASASKKIVINKTPKKEVKEEVTGWQAVLAEMERRKNGGLKAAPKQEAKVEKKPESKGSSKKKGKDFKDVMDELNYKLAVLRGDIVEEKDDEPDTPSEKNVDTPPPTPLTVDSESKPEASPIPVKKGGKPDIAAMLAKVKKPAGGQPSSEEKSAVSTPVPESKQPAATIAVPKATYLPLPPPLPMEWPPKPYISLVKPKAAEPPKIDIPAPKAAPKEKKMIKKQIIISEPPKTLPEGYYLASSKAGLVQPYEIVEAGTTTQAAIAELTQQFDEEDREVSAFDIYFDDDEDDIGHEIEEAHQLSFEREYPDINISNKKSIHDLPVPGSFMASIQRLKKAVAKREQINQFNKDLEFRNYEDSRLSTSNVSSSSSSAKKLQRTTIPEEFNFSTHQHFENKRRTFRKDPGQSDTNILPITTRLDDTVVHQSVHKYGHVDHSTAFWLQSLRESSNTDEATNKKKKQLGRMQGLPSQTILANLDKNEREGYEQEEGLAISEEYLQKNMRGTTSTTTPKFLSNDIVKRRQQERDNKLLQENQNQQLMNELNKLKKENLKEKALQKAKEIGAYKPHNRYRLHQKMIEKYNNKPEIGGINLEKVTQAAFEQYHLSSGGTTHASEHSNYSELPWENLRDESMSHHSSPYHSHIQYPHPHAPPNFHHNYNYLPPQQHPPYQQPPPAQQYYGQPSSGAYYPPPAHPLPPNYHSPPPSSRNSYSNNGNHQPYYPPPPQYPQQAQPYQNKGLPPGNSSNSSASSRLRNQPRNLMMNEDLLDQYE